MKNKKSYKKLAGTLLASCMLLSVATVTAYAAPAYTAEQPSSAKLYIEVTPFAQVFIVNANSVNFRSGPGLSYSSHGHLHRGTAVEVGSSPQVWADGMWWTAAGHNGRWGWIASQFLTSEFEW